MVQKSLISTVETYRLETEDDVNAFKQEQREEADSVGYTINNFNITLKEQKSKGEVVDSWYIVSIKKVFEDPKDIIRYIEKVYYNFEKGSF